MSFENDSYFILPKEEINQRMIELFVGSPENVDKLRYSLRLIDPDLIYKSPSKKSPKFCCVVSANNKELADGTMDEYIPYKHPEIRRVIKSADWDLSLMFNEVIEKYDFVKVAKEHDNGNLLQAVGEMHIVIYNLMKVMFFLFSKQYLSSQEKWRLFYGSTSLEKANESTIIQLNFFYDLITLQEKNDFEVFKNLRNDIVHDRNKHLPNHDLMDVLKRVNEIVVKYFIRHSFDNEQLLYKKLNFQVALNAPFLKGCVDYFASTGEFKKVDTPSGLTWVDFAGTNEKDVVYYRIIYVGLIPYDFYPRDISRIISKMSRGNRNVILYGGTHEVSFNHISKNIRDNSEIKEELKNSKFQVDTILLDKDNYNVVQHNSNLTGNE